MGISLSTEIITSNRKRDYLGRKILSRRLRDLSYFVQFFMKETEKLLKVFDHEFVIYYGLSDVTLKEYFRLVSLLPTPGMFASRSGTNFNQCLILF